MSLVIRRDHEIYEANGGWFQARWHFSFDLYRDPAQRGVGALRVFNDDRIVPGGEWPMHPSSGHRLPHVRSRRALRTRRHSRRRRHSRAGAAQVMSFSHQGGIIPSFSTDTSTVQQRQYAVDDRTDRWLQIMSPPGEDGLDLRQDARVWVRSGYAYLIDGSVRLDGIDGTELHAGDAVKLCGPQEFAAEAASGAAELILIETTAQQ